MSKLKSTIMLVIALAISTTYAANSASVLKECDAVFNPNKKFCYDGEIYDLCDGMSYNPTTHICSGDIANRALCNGMQYNPLKQKCRNNVIIATCGETLYNPATQVCKDNAVFTLPKCGETLYDLKTHTCQGNVVLERSICGKIPYNPATQECRFGTVFEKHQPQVASKPYKSTSRYSEDDDASQFNARSTRRYGIRASFNQNSVTTGNGRGIDKKYGIGMGGGGGLVVIIPISGDFAVRTGAEISYGTLYNRDADLVMGGSDKLSATEFALNVPVLIQYSFDKNSWLGFLKPSWLGSGVELDIPFATKLDIIFDEDEDKYRSAVDFGIIGGVGYNISSNILVDIRGNLIGSVLTNLFNGTLFLYRSSVGFTYFF